MTPPPPISHRPPLTSQDPEITWLSDGDGPPIPPTPSLYSLGTVKPSESTTRYFTFPSSVIPADCVLEIKLRYTLVSDPETTTEKVVLADMPIIAPFVCNYDFSPRVHPGAWPDYFSLDDELFNAVGKEEPAGKKLSPQGIIQRWCLTASVLGMGDDIVLEGWELPLEQLAGAAECNITTTPQKPTGKPPLPLPHLH